MLASQTLKQGQLPWSIPRSIGIVPPWSTPSSLPFACLGSRVGTFALVVVFSLTCLSS